MENSIRVTMCSSNNTHNTPNRDAKIYGEVVGYGASSDAHHVTSPPKDGAGAYQCMQQALEYATISPSDVGYVNAHATSTLLGDNAEVQAITRLFLQQQPRPYTHDTEWLVREYNRHTAHSSISEWSEATQKELLTQISPLLERNGPFISSNKGTFGHTLGAAGAIEVLCTILALHTQSIPPTVGISTSTIDPLFYDIPIVTLDNCTDVQKYIHKRPLQYAISNSFGFGGSDASLVFKRWSPST
uniref:beta-ketoacyl-[acyl-carrier-protein] synthase I n=1 Tax=Lygus hesperus TaxID=30085 RepID=A0A0A9XBV7_LYGHE